MPNLVDLIPRAYYEAWNDTVSGAVTESLFAGGRYSGKSTYIARCIAAMMCARGFEKCHAVVFRRHQVDLRESVYTEMELAINALGLAPYFEFKRSPLAIVRRDTGQTIFFNGLDDPRKHKSKKPPFGYVRWLWFEELDEFDCWEDVETVQISYQRGGELFQTFCSFNPPRSLSNWTNALAATHAPGRKVYRSDYRDLAEMGWVSPQVLERIEATRKTRPEVYRHTYLGEAIGTGGEIFTNVKDEPLTDEQVAEFRRRGAYGADWGIVNDPSVILGSWYDSDRDYLYIFDEWTAKHPFYTDIHKALVARGLDKVEIVADTAPAGWIQNINSLGARLHGCYKAEDWVETGISWLRSRTRIFIDSERCPLSWDEFVHYEYDYYRDGKPKEKLPDRNNHAIDACLRGDTLVEMADGSSVPIRDLAGCEGTLRAFDVASRRFVNAPFRNVRMTRRAAEMVRVEMADGRFVDCTADHRILTSNRGYVAAGDLTETDDIVTEENT